MYTRLFWCISYGMFGILIFKFQIPNSDIGRLNTEGEFCVNY